MTRILAGQYMIDDFGMNMIEAITVAGIILFTVVPLFLIGIWIWDKTSKRIVYHKRNY